MTVVLLTVDEKSNVREEVVMSWDTNIYYNPEKFELEQIMSSDIAGAYAFDETIVWRHIPTGDLYYASG